jgi:hypothetical protein
MGERLARGDLRPFDAAPLSLRVLFSVVALAVPFAVACGLLGLGAGLDAVLRTPRAFVVGAFDAGEAFAILDRALADLTMHGQVRIVGATAATFAGLEVILLPSSLAYALTWTGPVVARLRALFLLGMWLFLALWVLAFARWVAAA